MRAMFTPQCHLTGQSGKCRNLRRHDPFLSYLRLAPATGRRPVTFRELAYEI